MSTDIPHVVPGAPAPDRELFTTPERVLLAFLVPPLEAAALVERLSAAMRARRASDVFRAMLMMQRLRAAEGYDGEAFADLRNRLDAVGRAIRTMDGSDERWASVEAAMTTDALARRSRA